MWGGTGAYTYDPLGNRRTMNLGTRAVSYTYDNVSGHDTSRLKGVSEGNLTVNHDTAGNETLYGADRSGYSPRNYLATTGTTSFGYDGRGLRVIEQTTTGASLYTITPCRVFDTRNPTGPYGGPAIGAGATRAFAIWGQCGIPATGPQAIALNLTAVNPPVAGNLTLFPTDATFPGTSTISVKTGVTRANNAIIGLSAAGSLSLNNSLTSSIDMVLDVSGYFIEPLPAARYFFYTPEANLLAETGIAPNGTTPATLYEYVWFGGRPIAQETVGASATRWTTTDHLGTPFLQTGSGGSIVWRTENEPFGRVYAYTVGSAADPQPLRFPGQEERGTNSGKSYNIFRWYRPDSGQYTQADPVGLKGGINLYSYVGGSPTTAIDPLGQSKRRERCQIAADNLLGILRHGQHHQDTNQSQRAICAQLRYYGQIFADNDCAKIFPSVAAQVAAYFAKHCNPCREDAPEFDPNPEYIHMPILGPILLPGPGGLPIFGPAPAPYPIPVPVPGIF